METQPLHPAEHDLAALANRGVPDGMLATLIEAARGGMGATVGLLVNGMFVYGTLAAPSEAAKEVDDFFEWILGVAERGDDEERPEFWQAARDR